MICGKTLKNRVKSKLIKMTGLEPFKEFLRSQRLRWFGHNKKMRNEKASAMTVKIMVKCKKKQRPKKPWIEFVEKDMRRRGLQQVLAKKRQ